MPLFFLDETINFPPVNTAEPDGLLAIGGDLSQERLLNAYRSGIFPWYDEGPILWWSPDPRFVLFPENLKISKSMRPVLNQDRFRFSINTAFSTVIENCGKIKRPEQERTWINEEMTDAYIQLHKNGFAYSAEAWAENQLVGGLYGILLGKVFFGESMFSIQPNSSKFAFIKWVAFLQSQGVVLIDCQVYTEHLESLGAQMIPREKFLSLLSENIPAPGH